MSKRKRQQRTNEEFEALKEASGWYLCAWRHFRGLTMEELADEAGTSKSMVRELETGAPRKDGKAPTRFNRDWIDKFSRALGTTGGFLIDVNPYTADEAFTRITKSYNDLDEAGRSTAADLMDALAQSRGKRA